MGYAVIAMRSLLLRRSEALSELLYEHYLYSLQNIAFSVRLASIHYMHYRFPLAGLKAIVNHHGRGATVVVVGT